MMFKISLFTLALLLGAFNHAVLVEAGKPAPKKAPTRAPVKPPTNAPVKAPVAAPVASPIASSGGTCSARFADGSSKKCFTSLAGQTIPAGQVCVNIDGSNVMITYDTSSSAACLKEVHASLGESIPVNNAGSPAPGSFPMTDTLSSCPMIYTFTTEVPGDCSSLPFSNKVFKLAAHASVQFSDGNGGQTAWSVGKEVKAGGGGWATYSEVVLSCNCGDSPVSTPVTASTMTPTKAPAKTPTNAPVKSPTAAPVKASVAAPVTSPVAASSSCSAYYADGSTRMCYTSLAGQHIPAGKVCVEIVGSSVTITYDSTGSAACLKEVHASLGETIPVNNAGNPAPGNFPMIDTLSSCPKTYAFTTELPGGCSSSPFTNKVFKLAAHASVQFSDGNGGQTAWSVGKEVKAGGSWATYSEVILSCKCGSSPVASPVNSLTMTPTKKPSQSPTKTPTKAPTKVPTKRPTKKPTKSPTKEPSQKPTTFPTHRPTKGPTKKPTKAPTKAPTMSPTKSPTKKPAKAPTKSPTMSPTKSPTKKPTQSPTRAPTKSPTKGPTASPTLPPTLSPTFARTSVDDACYASFPDGSMKACFNTMAGQYYPAGNVCAELVIMGNQDSVKITYDTSGTDYCLTEVQAYFGGTIPSNKAGNPTIGNFPAKATMNGNCIKSYTVQMPLTPDCKALGDFVGRLYKLAAHSHVQFADGSGGQTAWSVGKEIRSGGSWATYSEAKLNCKCAIPTKRPSVAPTRAPTQSPTKNPSKVPTKIPSKKPTRSPTGAPTGSPTSQPTFSGKFPPLLDCPKAEPPKVLRFKPDEL